MIHKIKVNNHYQFDIETTKSGIFINKERISFDKTELSTKKANIIYKNKSFNVEIISINDDKTGLIKVNGETYTVDVENYFDQLIKQFEISDISKNKVLEIKSPMPGLVLNILVTEGTTVNKGDNLIVLEAMKMENNLKSPTHGTIKKIFVKKGDTVEKNKTLIQFT